MKVTDDSLKFKVYVFSDLYETSYKSFLEQIMCNFPPHDFKIMMLY